MVSPSRVGRSTGIFIRHNNWDINQGFLDFAQPNEYKRRKIDDVGAIVDGKVIQTEEPRGSNIMKRMMYNNKTSSTGVLYLDWILPCGLSFYHTPLFLGRLSETALVQLICDLKKVVVFHESDRKSKFKTEYLPRPFI